MSKDNKSAFEAAGEKPQAGLAKNIWDMLKQNKKYYLIPLIGFLILFGVIIILGGTAAAPFIYTLF